MNTKVNANNGSTSAFGLTRYDARYADLSSRIAARDAMMRGGDGDGGNAQWNATVERSLAVDAVPQANCSTNYDRWQTPENVIGDVDWDEASKADYPNYIRDRARLVQSFASSSEPGAVLMRSPDFTSVGTIGQVRACAERLYSGGKVDPTVYAATIAGSTATSTLTTPTATAIGVVVDWGISLLNYAPFDLQLKTTGFFAIDDLTAAPQSTDRNIVFRVSKTGGCSIYLPFAKRVSPPMQQALMQVSYAPTPDTGTVTVQALNLPAAIASAFSMSVQLLTNAMPPTAELLGMWDVY